MWIKKANYNQCTIIEREQQLNIFSGNIYISELKQRVF